MNRIKQCFLLLSLLLAMIFSFAASGQTSTSITGRVSDQTGAVIPKARVIAHNELTNQDISTVTTSTGDFTFTNLRPGLYDVSSTAPGFDTATETAVNLHLDAAATVKLILKPGASKENVVVYADETQLDVTHASRGEVFTQDELEQSPFNAGNPLMLVNSAPAVTFQGSYTASAQWVRPFDHQAVNQFSVNGGIADSNDFQMDGSPNNSITFGSRDIGTVPPTASVQEMKFIENPYDAQYGHTGGGIFDIVTKYGGNNLHGQVYENARRTWIDANTELNDSQSLAKASDKRDQYGFELDGPLVIPHYYNGHDKTFFAMQFERYNENDPQDGVASVPEFSPGSTTQTVAQTGDFSGAYYLGNANVHLPVNIYNPFTITTDYDTTDPRTQFVNNTIPSGLLNTTTKAILSYLPKPNRTTASNLQWGEDNYAWSESGKLPYDSATIRLDRNFTANDRTYIRFNWTKNWQTNADATTFDSLPGVIGRAVDPLVFQTHFFIADWQHTFTANSLFDIHLSFQRFAYNQNQGPSPFDLSKIGLGGLASSVTEQVFPQISIGGHGGVTEFGNNADNGGNKLTISNTIAAMPMWTYVHGVHTLKVGVDYRLQRSSSYYGDQASGEFDNTDWYTQQYASCLDCIAGQGSGLASFMLGIGDGGSIYTGVRQYFTYPYAAPFVQDDWKVTHKLTVNLGFRWDIQGAPTESANKVVGAFDSTDVNPISPTVVATGLLPSGTTLMGGMTYAGVNGQRRGLFSMNRFLIQPRVGFNYGLDKNTVIRGGVGSTYMQFTGQGFDQGFTASTSYVSSTTNGTTVNGSLISNPFPTISKPVGSSLGLESSLGNGFDYVNPNFKIPGVVNYSLGVERQIGQRTSVDVSYVGNRGFNLDSSANINHTSAGYSASCNLEMGITVARYEDCVHDTRATDTNYVTNPFKGIDAFSPAKTGNLGGYYTSGQLDSSYITRPYPEFGDITETEQNDGYTEYDSLQAVVSHHWHDALTLHGNFVWSKQMDGGGWSDVIYGIRQHYLDGGDRRWRFAANADWHLPVGRGRTFLGNSNRIVDSAVGNWVIGAIYTYEAGTAAGYSALEILHNSHYGVHERKEVQNVIRGSSKCVGWYDPNPSVNDKGGLSAGNSPYTLGDALGNDYEGCAVNSTGTGHVYDYVVRPSFAVAKNTSDTGIRNPRGQNLDLSVSKSFPVWKTMKLQIRFEGYNVANHPSWQSKGYWADAWDSHFGTINKYYDGQTNIPRQVQLSAKIIW
jgi:hypothetical protein